MSDKTWSVKVDKETKDKRINLFEIDKTEASEQIECLIQENKELKMFKPTFGT